MAELKREVIATPNAPAAIGPYSQAIRLGQTLYCSGAIGLDPKTGDFTGKDIESQTTRTLENVKAVLEAGGSSLSNVVKTTVLLSTMASFAPMNAIYAKYFPTDPPARSTFAVAGLPKNALIEIECIAFIPSQPQNAASPATAIAAPATKAAL